MSKMIISVSNLAGLTSALAAPTGGEISKYKLSPNYVGDLFVNALTGGPIPLLELESTPNELLEQQEAASSLTKVSTQPSAVTGLLLVDRDSDLNLITHSPNSNLDGANG